MFGLSEDLQTRLVGYVDQRYVRRGFIEILTRLDHPRVDRCTILTDPSKFLFILQVQGSRVGLL